MSDFGPNIDPAAEWADVPSLTADALALGGMSGPMNAQAIALAKRTKKLLADVETAQETADSVSSAAAAAQASATAAQTAATNAAASALAAQSAATAAGETAAAAQESANTAASVANAALPKAGGTMTGPITLAGNASSNLHAVPKQQLDAAIAGATIPDATTTVKGKVQLATNAEAQAGTEAAKAITPATLASAALIGVGQTWQNLTGSRAAGTTYTNTAGKPIQVNVALTQSADTATPSTLTVGGVVVSRVCVNQGGAHVYTLSAIVPPGATYVVTLSSATLSAWTELR